MPNLSQSQKKIKQRLDMTFESSHTIQKGNAQKGNPEYCLKSKVSALVKTL